MKTDATTSISRPAFMANLGSLDACREQMEDAWELMHELYPICRSITGDGLRQTLARICAKVPLRIVEIPSGTAVFDWEVPREWNVREAWISDQDGNHVVDLQDHTLHLMSYSIPIDTKMTLEELKPHLHSMPEHPDWIPYRTSYYREDWAFCLTQRVLESLKPGDYHVYIDSELTPGALSYGECLIPGESEEEVLIFTHVCHPSLCNDNLSGIAVATCLAAALQQTKPRFTHRFVFAPGTIGSICWLSANEQTVDKVRYGLVIGLAGDKMPLTYKRSRRATSEIDRIAEYVVGSIDESSRVIDFSPYGYDERQLCSPGFDLPVGRLTRSSNNEFDEYHSSGDNFDIIDKHALAESLFACVSILKIIDRNESYINRRPKCEPRLGKRGLFRDTGGRHPGEFEHALLWVLNQSDGVQSLLDIAIRSGISFDAIAAAADALLEVDLLRPVTSTQFGD